MSLLNRGEPNQSAPGAAEPLGRSSRDLRGWAGAAIGGVVVLALGATALILLTGNDDGDPPSQAAPGQPATSTSSTTPSQTPSPTPTASPRTPEQIATTGATIGYKRWVAVQNKVGLSGGRNAPQSELAAVATGTQLKLDRLMADIFFKQRGQKLITPSKIVSIKATSIGVPNSSGIISDVTLAVCEDVRPAYAVDRNGKSIVTRDRLPYLNDTVVMSFVGGTWKVKDFSNKPGRSCT